METSLHSAPTDLLPNPLASDSTDALTFWLGNPLLKYHYPALLLQRAGEVASLDEKQKRLLLGKLRETRLKLRAGRALPQPEELPTATLEECHWLFLRIDDKKERATVRAFACRLADCERPWLAERLRAALEARTRLGLAPPAEEPQSLL